MAKYTRRGVGVGLALCCLLVGPASAQAPKLKVTVSYDLRRAPTAVERLVLRPNTEQPVYFYVTNTGEELVKNVRVEVARVDVDGQPIPLQQALIPMLAGKETKRVLFAKEEKKEPAKGDKKDVAKDDKNLPEIKGLPYRLQVRLTTDKGVEKTDLGVIVMEPSEYVEMVEPPQFDRKQQKLTVRIKSLEKFTGPRCAVQLELDPRLIPGLKVQKTGGVYKQFISKPNEEVTLVAEDVEFVDVPPKNGRIYVTVDGYERAFMFKSTFGLGLLQPLTEKLRARIVAPAYSQPVPDVPVVLEVDGSPSLPARVELGFDRVGNKENYDVRAFRGLREQHVYVFPGPDGNLFFKTVVQDWKVNVDATDVFGRKFLRVRLLEGYEDHDKMLVIADEQNQADETIFLFQRALVPLYAPLMYFKNSVLAEIVLDGTPPQGVKLIDIPGRLIEGEREELIVRATIVPRTEDQAPLHKVLFFFGKLGADGKVPDDAVPGVFTKAITKRGEQVWGATLPIPSDKKDRLEVTVLATTLVGKAAHDTAKIVLRPPPPKVAVEVGKVKLATIKGVVMMGDLPQAGLTVTLFDEKGKARATVKTDAKGAYLIPKVEPGSYTVFSEKVATRTSGRTPVAVPEGGPVIEKVNIKLFR